MGSFAETKQFSQEEKTKNKKRRNVPFAPDGCGANMASMGKSRGWGQERGSLGLVKEAGPGLGDWGPTAALSGISFLWGCSQRLWYLGTRLRTPTSYHFPQHLQFIQSHENSRMQILGFSHKWNNYSTFSNCWTQNSSGIFVLLPRLLLPPSPQTTVPPKVFFPHFDFP